MIRRIFLLELMAWLIQPLRRLNLQIAPPPTNGIRQWVPVAVKLVMSGWNIKITSQSVMFMMLGTRHVDMPSMKKSNLTAYAPCSSTNSVDNARCNSHDDARNFAHRRTLSEASIDISLLPLPQIIT